MASEAIELGSPLCLQDYRLAPSGEGALAHQWKDKPHRLVYDLCNEIERLIAEREKMSGVLRPFAAKAEYADALEYEDDDYCECAPLLAGDYRKAREALSQLGSDA